MLAWCSISDDFPPPSHKYGSVVNLDARPITGSGESRWRRVCYSIDEDGSESKWHHQGRLVILASEHPGP